ncbi:lipid A biosynthesis lauroyl acyltransferase [Oricola thermophila]|uniref:Lipid A biosynthesis lauroyl acyltransferase n=1 Tax=Oricola thermophila TaxID=2742145 RepID=A0A6N1VE29_9HYPH|nr:lipid A biosynthesis lauroyl acyltransferase [Oricola thermophila]QKV17419.1 lipid A biosynthesis lauroyl acyltransferase [Oricola thermophila]
MPQPILRLLKHTSRLRLWLVAQLTFSLLALARLLPARTAIELAAALGQALGPFSSRHRIALDNLRAAFPEKNEEERQQIARQMWRNMFRLGAEYVYLEQLFDFDPDADEPGLIEVKGEDIFRRLQAENASCIFFTAHTGNFELLPVCAATFGLNVTALFRPPNNPYIAKRLLSARRTAMGHLVPSKAGAAWGLAKALEDGGSVGVLVDQKFHRGMLGTFFGRPVKTNPLLPKLARQFERPVHPARCVRLPGGRFRLELEEAIELPRTDDGEIDIAASAQMLNDIVERWVREYPDQWMWFHRRWDIGKP